MLVTGPQLYQPQVLMTHPQAAQPQSQQPQQPDDSSSSSSSSESTADSCEQKRRQKYNFRMRCKIATSATFISSLPKSRRAQLLEAICSRFDAAVTADMSNEDINKLIWLLTKVKPLTKICDLRVKRYFDLVAVLKVAAERVCVQRRGADALENLSSDMSNVDKLVREHGWQDDFSKTTTPNKKEGVTLRVRRLAQATRRFSHGCSSSLGGNSSRTVEMVMTQTRQSRMTLQDHRSKNQADAPA